MRIYKVYGENWEVFFQNHDDAKCYARTFETNNLIFIKEVVLIEPEPPNQEGAVRYVKAEPNQ